MSLIDDNNKNNITMNKTVYVVQELDAYGRYAMTSAMGVFDSLDAAVTSIMDNTVDTTGYSEEELNRVEDIRQYLYEHRHTPNLPVDYSIQEYEMNEWT